MSDPQTEVPDTKSDHAGSGIRRDPAEFNPWAKAESGGRVLGAGQQTAPHQLSEGAENSPIGVRGRAPIV